MKLGPWSFGRHNRELPVSEPSQMQSDHHFTWARASYRLAQQTNDTERLQFMDLFERAEEQRQISSDTALALYERGRDIALRLREQWWVLLFDHCRLQTLPGSKRESAERIDLAVRTVLEARKGIYARCPQRVCVHEDLIAAYMSLDPHGYKPLINESLSYMEGQVTPTVECYYCLRRMQSDFALETASIEQAQAAALRQLAEIQNRYADPSRNHYLVSAYARLCAVAFKQEDWKSLYGWETAGEDAAMAVPGQRRARATLTARCALAARRLGSE